jgi:hypothetical protein
MNVLPLAELGRLKIGMRPGLRATADRLPSAAADVDALLRKLGASASCAGDEGWVSDEAGILEKTCAAGMFRVEEVPVDLRFHLVRLELPDGDRVARLHRIELRRPTAGAKNEAWPTSMRDAAQKVYGPPGSTRQEPTTWWHLDDRFVVLAPASPSGDPALWHLALDDPDLPAYGLSARDKPAAR